MGCAVTTATREFSHSAGGLSWPVRIHFSRGRGGLAAAERASGKPPRTGRALGRVSLVAASFCRSDGRGDPGVDLRGSVSDQYGLGLSRARLAIVLRAGVSPHGWWCPL